MAYPITITSADMREINRSAILEIIRRESPISRTAIAERLDVSLPTVMRIVDGLVEEGFVRPQGSTEWSGGRRRPLLEFNAEASLVIGVDMGGTKMYGALSDLGGKIYDEVNIGHHGTSGEDSFKQLTTLIDKLLASPKVAGRKVQRDRGRRSRCDLTPRRHRHLGLHAALGSFSAQSQARQEVQLAHHGGQ